MPHYDIYDTICDSTEKRQAEVQCLAAQVDAVVVVGGKESGNTQRIYEVARSTGKPAFHVETEEELDLDALAQFPAGRRNGRGLDAQLADQESLPGAGIRPLPARLPGGAGPCIVCSGGCC